MPFWRGLIERLCVSPELPKPSANGEGQHVDWDDGEGLAILGPKREAMSQWRGEGTVAVAAVPLLPIAPQAPRVGFGQRTGPTVTWVAVSLTVTLNWPAQ